MTTDFRALCVELTEALRRQHDWYIEDNGATLPQVDELVVRAETTLAEADGPAVPEGREPASVAMQPSDHLYVRFASLEWKLGCHMSEWKAARELAYRMGKAGDELNQAHCDGVVRLLQEHLEVHGEA